MSRQFNHGPAYAHASPRQSLQRSAYPDFLSLPHTLVLQLKWGWHGLLDGFRWDKVVRVVMTDREVQSNMMKSLVVNGLALASVYALDLLLAPLVSEQQHWFHKNIGWVYTALWLLPVLAISFWLNVCYLLSTICGALTLLISEFMVIAHRETGLCASVWFQKHSWIFELPGSAQFSRHICVSWYHGRNICRHLFIAFLGTVRGTDIGFYLLLLDRRVSASC